MSTSFDKQIDLPPNVEVTLEKIFLVPPIGATRHLLIPGDTRATIRTTQFLSVPPFRIDRTVQYGDNAYAMFPLYNEVRATSDEAVRIGWKG
jgi:hypothetical protein